MELLYILEDPWKKTKQFTLLMQPHQTVNSEQIYTYTTTLFWISIFSFPVVIYFNLICTQLTLQWMSTLAPAVAERLTSKVLYIFKDPFCLWVENRLLIPLCYQHASVPSMQTMELILIGDVAVWSLCSTDTVSRWKMCFDEGCMRI